MDAENIFGFGIGFTTPVRHLCSGFISQKNNRKTLYPLMVLAICLSVLVSTRTILAAPVKKATNDSAAVVETAKPSTEHFEGRFYRGSGDVEYLRILDISRRMFTPDEQYQNISMLYAPEWNGLLEGVAWNAWWVQNSYGPTYCALPFLEEPLTTFLQNSQDLWFNQMGDGKTVRLFERGHKKKERYDWVPPDGALCDAATPTRFISKQGDGRVDIHDWGMEFTAAGLLMQAELLLISRDLEAINQYLPKLRRCAQCIENRRDAKNNLFLAGAAGNLLAPSHAGYKTPDGKYEKSYLTGLSVTYIAALDRLIELEKLAGNDEQVKLQTERRDLARKGLEAMVTDEGYYIKSLDPDGTKHGVYGAIKHGYFEAVCNHDAICFRVADDAQASKIYSKIAAIPGLRPYDVIITNYPSLDDLYTKPQGLWSFGRWVNGGHWSTCEARMIMGYCRLGKFEDARRSMRHLLRFARSFRQDNPLTQFGNEVYHTHLPITLCYDNFGPPAAMIRGLFEYLYGANKLTIHPRIPPGITRLAQDFPLRFGRKQIYLGTVGTGDVTAVSVNGKPWKHFDARSVDFPYEETPDETVVSITLGNAKDKPLVPRRQSAATEVTVPESNVGDKDSASLADRVRRIEIFRKLLSDADMADSYEAAHAELAIGCVNAAAARQRRLAAGELDKLPEKAYEAAKKLYLDTAVKLCKGLEDKIHSYKNSKDAARKKVYRLWRSTDAK